MTDRRDRPAELPDDRPDPAGDSWSAWLPPLDPTTDRAGSAGEERRDGAITGSDIVSAVPPAPVHGPPLPQSAGPAVPPAPVSAQQSYPQTATPAAAGEPMPRRHMGLAILSLFIGLPIVSIAAVIAAASVRSRWRKGNVIGAQSASRAALVLSIAAIVLRVGWGVVQRHVFGVDG